MSWYRTGTVAVTNGSPTVTGTGTLFTTAVNAGDAFALVDANLNPTGAWYEVLSVNSNTSLTLKQTYAGTTGSNNQYCVFNMVGNMTTPSFAQRLATFFASFQSLIDKPTATPTALGIPVADANGDIDSGWLKDASATVKGVVKVGSNISVAEGVVSVPYASATVKGVVELATSAEVLAGEDEERAVTPDTLTDKILGTVSQSGGVPTGAVIEQGSNANGEYVKFADGTFLCGHTVNLTGLSVSAGVSVYINTSWTLPVTATGGVFVKTIVGAELMTSDAKHIYGGLSFYTNQVSVYNTGGLGADIHPGPAISEVGSSVCNSAVIRLFAYGRWY